MPAETLDLAVDLGTANTLVYMRGHGVVLTEPSVVAVEERTGDVVAVGAQARQMLGRTPATITATRPLRDGVIRELGVTQQMLRHFIRKALDGRRARPRVMVCVPSGLTKLERRAVLEAAHEAGPAGHGGCAYGRSPRDHDRDEPMKSRLVHTPQRSHTDASWEARAYPRPMTHSKKTMWMCIAIALLAIVLSVALANPAFLLFLIPCMLMMGAMVWMMTGGMGGGFGGRGKR